MLWDIQSGRYRTNHCSISTAQSQKPNSNFITSLSCFTTSGHWIQGVKYSCTRPMSEKAVAPHSSTLAWKIPWMEKPGRLQSMESLRVGHNWVTSLSLSCIGEGNGNPLQCSCLENPRDGGAWWAAVYGVAQNQTRLKRLSSSSSSKGKVHSNTGLPQETRKKVK